MMPTITFILTDPTLKIVGGYKMVYFYANELTQKGFRVNIDIHTELIRF